MRNAKKKGTIRSKIKRGDQVVFVAGKEFNRYDSNGKRNPYRGKVIAVNPYDRKVKVEGAMIVKKHQKPNPQLNIEGGILQIEAWVAISNVSHIDPKSGEPTRIGYETRDGSKLRISKKSGEPIPEPSPFVKAEKATKEESVEEKSEEKATDEDAKDSKESKKDEE